VTRRQLIVWCLTLFLCLAFWPEQPIKAAGNVVYWEGMKLVKGQIGKLEIIKPINLWKKENGKPMIGNPDVMIEMKINGGNSYRVDSINKPRFANHLVIYTPYFSSSTQTNSLGTEVILTNLQGKLNGNGTLTGTVKQVIAGKGNEPLLPGEIVLSGHGQGMAGFCQKRELDRMEICNGKCSCSFNASNRTGNTGAIYGSK
jgi:hypothetical protein